MDAGSERLLCVGDLNLDLTITTPGPIAVGSDTSGMIAMSGGGSAGNVAAWSVQAGLDTRFVGVVGDDVVGDFLADELDGHGVEVRATRRTGSRSRSVAVVVGVDGNRSIVSDLDTTVLPALDDHRPDWFAGIGWLHLTGYTYFPTVSRPLFARLVRDATDRSIPYSIDPSAAQLMRTECDRAELLAALRGAHVLFPSHDEAEYLTGSAHPPTAAERLLELADGVVVTCGADGAYIARREQPTLHVEAPSAAVVNTLGCGDAFAAGFIAGRMRRLDDRECARMATDLAGRALAIPTAR